MKEDEIKAVLFDFGGVIAEEGFEGGLKAIGKEEGIDPDRFFSIASELIHETGYVTGLCGEGTYWNAVRERTGITGSDSELREEVLKRFVLRPRMIAYAKTLRDRIEKIEERSLCVQRSLLCCGT